MAKWQTNNFINATPALINCSTVLKTFMNVMATTSALRRIMLYEFSIAASSNPNATDCCIQYDLARSTADGTGVVMTPLILSGPLDTGTVSTAVTTAKGNYTAEPTYTAQQQLDYNAFNQRASLRYTSIQGGEFWVPGVAANGIGIRCLSPAYASSIACSMKFEE